MADIAKAFESVVKALQWIIQRYPAFWKWLLPDPPATIIILLDAPDEAVRVRNINSWRSSWEWMAVPAFAYIGLVDGFFFPWTLIAFCTVVLGLSGVLARFRSIPTTTGKLGTWRQALCGSIWIWSVYVIPAALWAVTRFCDTSRLCNLPTPPVPDPGRHLPTYILTCGCAFLTNCILVRWIPSRTQS